MVFSRLFITGHNHLPSEQSTTGVLLLPFDQIIQLSHRSSGRFPSDLFKKDYSMDENIEEKNLLIK